MIRFGRAWMLVLALPCVASCTLAGVELDSRACPCVTGYACVDDVCIAGVLAGDGDGDALPPGDGDGDGLSPGDGDGDALPMGDGDGDGDGLAPGDGDGDVPPPTCVASACPTCITIAAMLPCCTDADACSCKFPGVSCK